jgi:phosphohistidine phosphatase
MTTRRLVLLRHAKAASHGGVDAERPLAHRGLSDATAVGQWIADQAIVADRVVVSPARRAAQTWALAAAELPVTPPHVVDDRIYDNTLEDLLAVIRETPSDVGTLVLVGHNPSMHGLALTLDDGEGDAAARTDLRDGYPTSGTAVFTFAGDWPDVGSGVGTLTGFAAPHG